MDEERQPTQKEIEKEKANENFQDVAKEGAKAAINAYTGNAAAPVVDKAVDKAAENPAVKGALNAAGNKVNQNPFARKMMANHGDKAAEGLKQYNQASSGKGGGAGGAPKGAPTGANPAGKAGDATSGSKEQEQNKGGAADAIGDTKKQANDEASKTVQDAIEVAQGGPATFVKKFLTDKNFRNKVIIGAIVAVAFQFIIIMISVMFILAPIIMARELISAIGNGVTDFFKSFGNWFVGNGWCPNEASCSEKAEYKFYEEVTKLYESYKADGIELNTDLLVGTVMYRNMDFEGLEYDPDKAKDWKSRQSSLATLADKMVNNGRVDYRQYRAHLVAKYIPDKHGDMLKGLEANEKTRKINEIATEMMYFSDEPSAYMYSYGDWNKCPGGVTVIDDPNPKFYRPDAPIGVFPLEEYVAGVLAAEVNNTWGPEALKAKAVAIRSYTIARSDNCTRPLKNSISDQTFNKTTDSILITATEETSGEILEYYGSTVTAEYSAWFGPSSDCTTHSCDGTTCKISLVKLPNKERWEFTMEQKYMTYGKPGTGTFTPSDSIPGGHCRGINQFGIKYLDLGAGKDYKEILQMFYSDGVEIKKMSMVDEEGLLVDDQTGFQMRVARAARLNSFFYDQQCDCGAAYTLEGECAWWATGRAKEILTSVGNPNTNFGNANGGSFCNLSDANRFVVSRDPGAPKQGALISWSGGVGHNYGHVAVIERVNPDGSVDISEAGVSFGTLGRAVWEQDRETGIRMRRENCEGNNSGCMRYKQGVRNPGTVMGSAYTFQCYIYLTDPK